MPNKKLGLLSCKKFKHFFKAISIISKWSFLSICVFFQIAQRLAIFEFSVLCKHYFYKSLSLSLIINLEDVS